MKRLKLKSCYTTTHLFPYYLPIKIDKLCGRESKSKRVFEERRLRLFSFFLLWPALILAHCHCLTYHSLFILVRPERERAVTINNNASTKKKVPPQFHFLNALTTTNVLILKLELESLGKFTFEKIGK